MTKTIQMLTWGILLIVKVLQLRLLVKLLHLLGLIRKTGDSINTYSLS